MRIGNVLEKENGLTAETGDALAAALDSLDSIILGKAPDRKSTRLNSSHYS